MKVLVLGGGNSTERAVSLRSAKAVADALRSAGFEVMEADPADPGVLDDVAADTLVFPILHGAGGEDGSIQKELENRNLPYLGSDSHASEVCFDKAIARDALAVAGLPIAQGGVVTAATYANHALNKVPHVLKVTTGGSSIGTYLVRDPANIDQKAVEEVFALGNEAVIEELIDGVEITVPVLGAEALPVIEIRPPADGEFDYENKYNGATAEICPAESIDQTAQAEAQRLAIAAHQALGCRHLSRTDLMVRPNGQMVILEVNTIPGLTDQSLYPKAAAVAGLPMPELMKKFVEMVKESYGI